MIQLCPFTGEGTQMFWDFLNSPLNSAHLLLIPFMPKILLDDLLSEIDIGS